MNRFLLYNRYLLVVAFTLFHLVFHLGCGASGGDRVQVLERISLEEQSLSAIGSAPTSFVLPRYQQEGAWKRSQLFFRQYANRFAIRNIPGENRGLMIVSRDDSPDKYFYRIEKRPRERGAYEFVVVCAPNLPTATREAASRNAKNLARFIREGTLEISLLDR